MAAVLRLFRLGHQSLWVDEIFTWYSSDVGRPLELRSVLDNVHGPLHAYAVHLSGAAFGDHEWALRLPSAIAGVLMVPAMAWLADRWMGRATMAWAAWLTALSPFLVWYSQEARNYSFLLLFATLSSAALLEARERPGLLPRVQWIAAGAGALLSNLSFSLLAPLHARWWFAPGEGRAGRVRFAAIAVAVLVLAASPWLPQIARTWDWRRLEPVRTTEAGETPLRHGTTFHLAGLPFTLHTFVSGYTFGPSLRELKASPKATLRRHLPELLGELAVWGTLGALGLAAAARRGRLIDTAVWIGAPVVAVSYFAIQNFKVFNPRYLAVTLPCVLVLLAAGLASARRPWRVLLGLGALGLSLLSLAHLYFEPAYGREDYRGAVAIVKEGRRPDERVVTSGSVDPVEYYAAKNAVPVERWWLGWAADTTRMTQKFDETLARSRGLWVILSRADDLDPEDRFASMLNRRFPSADRWQRPGVRVWHIRRPE